MLQDPALPDDSLNSELAFLEKFLDRRPAAAPILLSRLGELGEEGRLELPTLWAERRVRLDRLAAQRRQQRGTRAAAVAALVVLAPTMAPAVAVAAEEPVVSQAAIAAPLNLAQVELRVMDRASGQPLSGVRLQTASEELVAVTDGQGRAMVPARFTAEPVLTLEREGYPMVLIEGGQLTGRNMITMKRFSGGQEWSQAHPAWPDPTQLATAATSSVADGAPAAAPSTARRGAGKAREGSLERSTGEKPAGASHGAPRSTELAHVPPDMEPASGAEPAARPVKAPVHVAAPVVPAEAPVAVAPKAPAVKAPKPAIAPAPVADKPADTRAELAYAGHDANLPSPTPIVEHATPVRPSISLQLPGSRAGKGKQAAQRLNGGTQVAAVPHTKPVHTAALPPLPVLPPQGAPPVPEAPAAPQANRDSMAYATVVLPRVPRPARIASALNKPARVAAAPVAEHANSYTVRSGDMLCSIAQRELGSASLWSSIYYANRDKLVDSRTLQVGAVLTIPRGAAMEVIHGGQAAGSGYVVQAGDTLSRIALEHLGTSTRWREIYALNRHVISSPRMIYPGQHLTLPGGGAHVAQGPHPTLAWATKRAHG